MSSPHITMMDTKSENIVRQELITYQKSDVGMKKITVVRQFFNEDYVDSRHETVLNSMDV